MQIPQWTVAFLQRDWKFSISALTQSTAESTDPCGKCESAFSGARDHSIRYTPISDAFVIKKYFSSLYKRFNFDIYWRIACFIQKNKKHLKWGDEVMKRVSPIIQYSMVTEMANLNLLSFQSLFEELVLNGIIRTFPSVHLKEFLGDISYTAWAHILLFK